MQYLTANFFTKIAKKFFQYNYLSENNNAILLYCNKHYTVYAQHLIHKRAKTTLFASDTLKMRKHFTEGS